jgi:hypothetical protein
MRQLVNLNKENAVRPGPRMTFVESVAAEGHAEVGAGSAMAARGSSVIVPEP